VRGESVDGLIQKMISARMRESAEGCADDNTMAAYLEAGLSPQEKAAFESHVSECAACQEILALSMKLHAQEAVSRATAAPDAVKKTLFRFSVPIPVLGAVLICIVLIAVLVQILHDSSRNLSKSQSAAMHPPAQSASLEAPVARHGSFAPPRVESSAAAKSRAEPMPPVLRRTAEQKMAAAALPAGGTPATPPSLKTARNRIAQTQDVNSFRALSSEDAIAGSGGPAKLEAAESRKIGDKVFYLNAGYWIDQQCTEHPGGEILEIAPTAPEYGPLSIKYPGLGDLRPALICTNGRNYLLR
jgi:hypothetical protein